MKTFKTFYSFIWRYKGYFIGAIFTGILSTVSGNFAPFVYRYIVDNFYNFNFRTFFLAVAIYGAARLGMILFNYLSEALVDKYHIRAIPDARMKVFNHLQNLDFAFHSAKRSGEFISKIKRGDSAFANIDQDLNNELIFDFVRLAIVTFAFSLISQKLVFVFFVAIFLIAIVSAYFIKKNLTIRIEHNKEEDNVSHLTADNLINYETIKYFANEKREITNFKKAFEPWIRSLRKLRQSFRTMAVSVQSISFFAMIAVFVFLSPDIIDKKISVGDFVLVFSFINQIFPSIERMMFRLRIIMRNYTDLKDYFAILDYPLVVLDPEKPLEFFCQKGEVEFKNISFSYPDGQDALKNVSLTVSGGTSVALAGRSGSGKTTLTKLLLRVYDPDEGQVLIDGFDIKQIRKEDLRKNIGIVPQEPILFNNTIGYNIGYPLENASREEIESAAKLANLHDFIAGLKNGYDTLVGERGVKLSGGQKQRLAIARVFLLNPNIIIFDEATSHLDSESERLIQDSIEKLAKGKTFIAIAHRLSTIMKADKIVVLDDGKIIEEGTHNELLSQDSGIYKKLWELQTNHEILENGY